MIDQEQIESLFESMKPLKVLVVGDLMVDNYWWGEAERMSPEAPVPVVRVRKKENRLGGAANVALNCRRLGAQVSLASVTGDDEAAETALALLREEHIDTQLIRRSSSRITTTKTRVLGRNQQMMRLDEESDQELLITEEHEFLHETLKFLQIIKPDVLLFEDYNKGVLKENVIRKLIDHARTLGIKTSVDPKKKNFLAYKQVGLFKPNWLEVKEGLQLGALPVSAETLEEVDARLRDALDHEISLITLSEKGAYVRGRNKSPGELFPSHHRQIADVSGAGDTVIAVASLLYALDVDPLLIAQIANIAGGLVCEEVGVVPIQRERLIQESLRLLAS